MTNGDRVVFDASGSYIVNKMANDILWLRERWWRPQEVTGGVNRLCEAGACSVACKSK